MNIKKKITSGFVSVIGRPNSGKSTLLNTLINLPLALVSKKANATRKRMDFIIPFENEELNSQIIFLDTPGLHQNTKMLNQYMINEALMAIGDSDLSLFISVASKNDTELIHYQNFIQQHNKKHILILNKIDKLTQKELLECLAKYQKYQEEYLALVPISALFFNDNDRNRLLLEIAKHLPLHPHFYDNDIMSTTLMRDIYKEAIREAIFERLNDEIPYESDVKILQYKDNGDVLYIKAQIIVEKDSQKSMVIGKNGTTIKSLGILARQKCQIIYSGKVFLELYVKTLRGWSKDKKHLKTLGYDFEL